MAHSIYLVHYHEVALKGKNRPWFEKHLVRNIERALEGLGECAVRRLYGRILVDGLESATEDAVAERLGRVFGVSSFSRGHEVGRSMDELCRGVIDAIAGREFGTFAVRARRSDKSFPLDSQGIGRELGARIVEATGKGVDLDSPDLPVHVEVLHRSILFYLGRHAGAGGLPVGVSGKVALLLSGGIDSPVAAWRMLRRGARVFFVHFHSHPFTSFASVEKVLELVKLLQRYQATPRIYLIPLGDIQQRVAVNSPEGLRVLLYRRFMFRIASRIALLEKAGALATGESLGQVASQTLENLGVVEDAAELPVLRPLVGLDKNEIIETARRIGTFETSTLPHEDCCSFLLPRHPETRARLPEVLAAESELEVQVLVEEGVRNAERRDL